MGLMKTSRYIVFVILLCSSASMSSEESRTTEEVFLSQLVDPATGKIDGDMAQLLWISCRVDLIHLTEAIEHLDLWLAEETSSGTDEINSKTWLLGKEKFQKLINVLHPEVKHTLSDCLRKHNLLFSVSGEEGASKIWYAKYIEPLFPRPYVPRRNLASDLPQSILDVPSPASAPRYSQRSPAPSPGLAPSTSQSPSPRPARHSSQGSFVPSDPINSSLQSSGPASGSNIQEHKGRDEHKTIVTAVIITASITFIVAALLFLCCTKICRNGKKGRQNDERPLLSLSLTDSAGSSYKSYAMGNSMKEEKLDHQSLELGSPGGASKFDASNNINGLVPPPPGMSPLKPPPGRAKLLPPEPPSSFRPPPSRAGPPPPPPVPAALKAAGSAGPPPPPPPAPPGPRPPPPPGPHPPPPPGPRPPPPPKSGVPPPRPPPAMAIGSKVARPPPLAPKRPPDAGSEADGDAPKTKLKPFFWDKVLANPDHSMVWHQIKSGSFQFDENMIETLFGYNAADKNKNELNKESSSQNPTPQLIQLINPKKAQNLSILLRALTEMQGLRRCSNDVVHLGLSPAPTPPSPPPPPPPNHSSSTLSIDVAESAETRIRRLISEHPVIIFSRNSCCMCHVMKKLLATIGVHPTVIELDDDEIAALPHDDQEQQQACNTLPAVFIGGTCVGAELAALSVIRHENLVRLQGCCVDGAARYLVYDYMENNSLTHTLLGGEKNRMRFSWEARRGISIGVARGLAYLHEEVDPHILHRDIKSSNILLDKNFIPKVGDFGLSKLLRDNNSHVSTRVAGTIGYLAPEYAISGRLTRKSDVYSFGVLLLEIVSGQAVVDFDMQLGEQYLVQKVWEAHMAGTHVQLVDPTLQMNFPSDEAIRFLKLGLLCVQERANHRPRMSRVVEMLSGKEDIKDSHISQPGHVSDFMDIKTRQENSYDHSTFSKASTSSSTQNQYKSEDYVLSL